MRSSRRPEAVGLEHRQTYPFNLSKGQRQRVVRHVRTEIIVLDEPPPQDFRSRCRYGDSQKLNENGHVIFITHDMS